MPGADETTVTLLVGVLIGLFFLLRGAVVVGQAYFQYRVAENAAARLATRMLDGYLSLPWSFHVQRNSAELVRNIYENVQQFARDALIPAVKLISQALVILGLLGVLMATSPLATLAAVGVLGPFTWGLLRMVHPRVTRLGRISQQASKASLQILQESLAGWRDITLLGRRSSFVGSYSEQRRRLARARYLRFTAQALPRVAMESGLVLLILALLGTAVLGGDGALAALPELGLFGYAAVRLQPPVNDVLVALNSLRFAGPGIDHVFDDLQLFEPPDGAGAHEAEPRPLRHELRLQGVTARYPTAHRDALRDVDLTIRRGEFIGVVGPTGGGKSTLVDVMLGLLEPAKSSVRDDGEDIRRCAEGWHASIEVVHQTVFLADTTLRRNVALGVPEEEIDDERVLEAVELAQLDQFVSSLPGRLETVVGERGVRLSGGQRQRLAIARALYRRPSVLFFGEGTSALDSSTEAQLMEALERLRGERTIIAVAHRVGTVRACDRLVLIEEGRVVSLLAPGRRHRELLPRILPGLVGALVAAERRLLRPTQVRR